MRNLRVVGMSTAPASVSSADACQRPIKDELGHWLCVLCPTPTRITRVMQTSRPHGAGRAHQKCIKNPPLKRPASVEAADLPRERPPQPLSVASSSSSVVQLPTTVAAPTSVEADAAAVLSSTSPHRRRFDELGHTLVPSSEQSRSIAWGVTQLCHRSQAGGIIAGDVKQLDLSVVTGGHELAEEWDAVVKQTAVELGIDVESMFVVDSKLLSAPPGRGHQPIHFDCARTVEAREKFSCLLVCSNGCYSTALPRFAENTDLSFSNNRRSMQQAAHLLDDCNYDSVPVSVGDIIFFRQSTPHRGVANTMPQGNRIMLFSILSPSDEEMQDDQQVFPWLYIGDAFGWESFEFAQALVRERRHKPIQRITRDYGQHNRKRAEACLSMWELTEEYQSKP